jgi:iron complex transport system substrate-binding protein
VIRLPTASLLVGLWIAAMTPASGEVPRIVSLAPHLTELAFDAGIGDHLVGAVSWSDHPPEAEQLPTIGDAFRLDLERIVRLDATHALAWVGGTPVEAVSRLEDLGIIVHTISIRSLDDIASSLLELGELGDSDSKARRAADAFNQRRKRLADRYADVEPSVPVFYQVTHAPLFTLGARHVINDVLKLCGANNVFSDLDVEAAAIDLEALLKRDPAAIVASRAPGEPAVDDLWEQRTSLRAVRCGNLLDVDPSLMVRPTTRLLEGAALLCGWLDREVRPNPDPACRIGRD